MVPVALITAVVKTVRFWHPTSAALIISWHRHSSYPHRGRWRNRARTVGNGLSDRGRDWLQRRAEIARVSVRQTPDGHGRQPRPLCWSFMGWRQACVASRNWDYGTLDIYVLVEGGWSGGWSDGRRSDGMSPL